LEQALAVADILKQDSTHWYCRVNSIDLSCSWSVSHVKAEALLGDNAVCSALCSIRGSLWCGISIVPATGVISSSMLFSSTVITMLSGAISAGANAVVVADSP
jgi:hypothetical protein